jgi:hypothetical protein
MVIIIFSIDYVLRLLTVHSTRDFEGLDFNIIEPFLTFDILRNPHVLDERVAKVTRALNTGAIRRTVKWALTPMNLIDIFSILPYFLAGLIAKSGIPNAMLVLRILRLCRLFRLFKLGKYSAGFEVFFKTIDDSLAAISVLLLILALLLVFLGSLIFLAEGGTWHTPTDDCMGRPCGEAGYPDGAYLRLNYMGDDLDETPFLSIFDACWFAVTTITTVGYGDLSPTSPEGRTIAMVCMLVGILAMAMPITVLGNNFGSQFDRSKHTDLLQKLDVFTTLRVGLEKYMITLDRSSKEYGIAEDEMEKLATVEQWLKTKCPSANEISMAYFGTLRNSINEVAELVEGVESRLDGLEQKMGEVMEVLEDL